MGLRPYTACAPTMKKGLKMQPSRPANFWRFSWSSRSLASRTCVTSSNSGPIWSKASIGAAASQKLSTVVTAKP